MRLKKVTKVGSFFTSETRVQKIRGQDNGVWAWGSQLVKK